MFRIQFIRSGGDRSSNRCRLLLFARLVVHKNAGAEDAAEQRVSPEVIEFGFLELSPRSAIYSTRAQRFTEQYLGSVLRTCEDLNNFFL